MDNMTEVKFGVPLSGSKLFDLHTEVMAKRLVTKFPGLTYNYDIDNKKINIVGELNDYWYGEWCKAMFEIGEIQV